jgi:hypothetical protein
MSRTNDDEKDAGPALGDPGGAPPWFSDGTNFVLPIALSSSS